MPVIVAKHAGFCMGVSRAVETAVKAAKLAKEQNKAAFSLGELIHNPAVVRALMDQGLVPVDAPEKAKDGVLVIRSHGVSPGLLAECKLHASQVVDCTCPFVHHVHQQVKAYSQDGKPVVIVGDPDHPEVQGIIGWCQGESHVVNRLDQVYALPEGLDQAMVVSQTTYPPDAFFRMSQRLVQRYPGILIKNTICAATEVRQQEALELAKQCDRMIVIGGKASANTRKLAETCKQWCENTYLIESAEEIPWHLMDPQHEIIGITAGASTPAWSLKEVVNRMNDMELNKSTQNPETEQELAQQGENLAQEAQAEVEEVAQEQTESAAQAAQEVVEDATEAVLEATEATEEAKAVEEATEAVAEAAEAEADNPPAEEVESEVVQETAEEPIQEAEKQEEVKAPSFMDEVAASMSRIRNGQTITGKIVLITEDEVCVNIGYKSDGLLKKDEMVDKDAQLGDEIEVEVVKVNDGEGNVILSQRNIVNRKVWADLMEKYEAGELVDGVGKEAVKGGLLATIDGVRAFVPASHLAQRYVEKISQFVDQPMKLKIIEVDQSKKRVVASRKEALAIENESIKEAVWSTLEEGAVVKGIVRRFTNFGAFVDLGGVDGLIHISDLSWSRSVSPSDILEANQEVDVKILSLDRERDRIALGYKQLQPRPWDNVEEKYPVGTILTRTIVRVRPFGAFIELEPGVDGLVHISQVAHHRVEKIEDVVSPGQEVDVKVLAVDPVAKRISLSIREATADPGMSYGQDQGGYQGGYEDSYGYQEPAAPTSYTEPQDRLETSIELAMRKAREELEAQEALAAKEEAVEQPAEETEQE